MSDTIAVEPFFEMMARKSFWAEFTPDRDAKDDTTPIESKARWLTGFLNVWAGQVYDFLVADGPEFDKVQGLEWLLESLANAADALLAYRRRDYPIPIPDQFSKAAYLLFVQAEEGGVQAGDQTVYQVALRLAAASSHLVKAHRPVRVDELGRTFEVTGERLFQFDPEKILKSRDDIKNGRTHSLRELREAEARND